VRNHKRANQPEATPYGKAPRFLMRDRESNALRGAAFARAARGSSIEILETPYRAPKANAVCERFLGSVRRECLDHVLVWGDRHLHRVIREYVEYFNRARPHQGIAPSIPEGTASVTEVQRKGQIIAFPALNGLQHAYRRVA